MTHRVSASTVMHAAVSSDGTVAMTSVPRTTNGDGFITVRVTHALVTPLEREAARGLGTSAQRTQRSDASMREPRVIGHAACGVVEHAAPNVSSGAPPANSGAPPANSGTAPANSGTALTRGTRVIVHPVLSCGACDRCRSGLSLHCRGRIILGVDAPHGALAEFVTVPMASVSVIPHGLDEERAVFAAPLSRAIEAVRRGGVEKKTFASILGDDLVAILTTLVAVEENPLARLVATHDATLTAAEQFGIRHRALHETGQRGDQELVIETTGSAESIAAAARMVRARGHVVVAGISARAPVAVDLSHVALDEIEIHGSGFGPLAGAIERLASRAIDPSPLIARRVGFTDVPRAVMALAEPGVFSVLVQVSR